jgi:regulator of replication initiation timing
VSKDILRRLSEGKAALATTSVRLRDICRELARENNTLRAENERLRDLVARLLHCVEDSDSLTQNEFDTAVREAHAALQGGGDG